MSTVLLGKRANKGAEVTGQRGCGCASDSGQRLRVTVVATEAIG